VIQLKALPNVSLLGVTLPAYFVDDVTIGDVSGVGVYRRTNILSLNSELLGIVQGVNEADLQLGTPSGGLITLS
jgi:hypothetical protein